MFLDFRKNRSCNFIPYFLLTSFVCGALGGEGLFASTILTTTVTTHIDNGTGSNGTLSAAIDTINGSSFEGLIQIESSGSPMSITGNMPSIMETLTIESDGRGRSRVINGGGFDVISVVSGTTTLTPDVTLSNANTSVTGSGILVFEGAVNSSGVNTVDLIDGGTVRFLVPQTYAGAVSIDDSGVIFGGADLTITGQISEASAGSNLRFEGPYGSSIVLDNSSTTNEWTGGGSIIDVALRIKNSNSFPSSGNTIVSGGDGGNLIFALSDSDIYTGTGDIAGGEITLSGGTVNLSGNIDVNVITINAGTGNLSGHLFDIVEINIDAGTLILSGSIDSQYQTTAIQLDGGTLQISSVNNFDNFEIILMGDSTLHSTGNVTFLLTEGVSFTGGTFTTDDGATLTIPSLFVQSGNSSAVALTLNGPGTNIIQQFDLELTDLSYELSVSGVLGGSEGLSLVPVPQMFVDSIGTLALESVNTYTGPTLVSSVGASASAYCILQVNSGASFGTNSDTVTVASSSSPYAALTNSGAITSSTFTNYGTTTLNTGSTITCSESYANYGTVTGCGTVTVGGSYVNSGTTSTGCSPSPLTIIGNVLYVSGSVLSPYLDTSGVAGFNVSGDLTLDSGVTLTIRPELGCYTNGAQHQFLSVGGTFTGTFSTVDMGTILLVPNITYGEHGAILTIERVPLGSLVPENNAKQVGKVLDVLIEEGIGSGDLTFCELIGDLLLLSQEGLSTVLDQMQPSLFKGLAIAQESSMVRVQESLNNRMQTVLSEKHCMALPSKKSKEDQADTKACSKDKKPFHVWAAGMGNALHQSSTYSAGSPHDGYHETMGGATLGIDAFFAKYLYAGVLGAYTSSDIKWNNGQGKGNIQSGYAGTYFSAIGDMFYGNASVIGSLNSYHAQRTIFLPTSQRIAKNNHGGPQLLSHLDTGVNLGWGWFSLKPFDSFDYIVQKERGFTETGAGNMDLSVKKSNAILIRNELGLNFSGCFCTGGTKWVISPKISWVREVRVKGSTYTANFVNTDETFTVIGYFPDRSLVSPGVNVTGTMLEDRLTLTAYYNGEIRGNYNNHSYGGEVRFGF